MGTRMSTQCLVSMNDGWRNDAACKGVDGSIFFPENVQSNSRWEPARKLCNECPVTKECLLFALQWEDLEDRWGMFGGLTPNERNLTRSARRKWQGERH
jgi:WhiB family redox-sensing transcriptional regulator